MLGGAPQSLVYVFKRFVLTQPKVAHSYTCVKAKPKSTKAVSACLYVASALVAKCTVYKSSEYFYILMEYVIVNGFFSQSTQVVNIIDLFFST